MDHTTAINVFLIAIVVLFIGGLIMIGRVAGKRDKCSPDTADENPRRHF